jgi:NAD(P)-dependent dehydrogenase (short-subunit alcohol dehydrogenase family)
MGAVVSEQRAANFDLQGRVAVVTGGAGILGRHFCAALAEYGASVAILDLDAEETAELAQDIERRFAGRAVGLAVDVTSPDEVKSAIDTVEELLGPIDILHNNAATKGEIDRFFDPIEEFGLDTWRKVMSVNLDGAFLVAREVGCRMARRGRGSIIQTGSIYGHLAPDQRIYEGSSYEGRAINTPPVYSASKSGLEGLTRYLAGYWGGSGVRVNTLVAGGVKSGQNDVFEKNYSSRVPLGRMANPEDLCGPLIFLASDASSYITGQSILVDGGLSAW